MNNQPSKRARETAENIYYNLRGISGAVIWGTADRARIVEIAQLIQQALDGEVKEEKAIS